MLVDRLRGRLLIPRRHLFASSGSSPPLALQRTPLLGDGVPLEQRPTRHFPQPGACPPATSSRVPRAPASRWDLTPLTAALLLLQWWRRGRELLATTLPGSMLPAATHQALHRPGAQQRGGAALDALGGISSSSWSRAPQPSLPSRAEGRRQRQQLLFGRAQGRLPMAMRRPGSFRRASRQRRGAAVPPTPEVKALLRRRSRHRQQQTAVLRPLRLRCVGEMLPTAEKAVEQQGRPCSGRGWRPWPSGSRQRTFLCRATSPCRPLLLRWLSGAQAPAAALPPPPAAAGQLGRASRRGSLCPLRRILRTIPLGKCRLLLQRRRSRSSRPLRLRHSAWPRTRGSASCVSTPQRRALIPDRAARESSTDPGV